MGVEIRQERAVTRYLLWGSLAVMVAYLAATWGVMVTVPPGEAAGITSVAQAVGIGLGEWAGRLVALMLAAMFFIITVVYNYSFARLIFVSGLDRRLPKVVSHVNAQKVPDVAVWIQTVLAAVFTVVAFVVVPFASATPADAQTEVYNVLQAAVTVIWCLSIVVLFVDVLIILRRYRAQFEERRLASPAVFWVASIVGALASLVGVVATLSGSWTPLISNDAGSISLFGAEIAYGTWFWLVGGIALASLAVGALLYLARPSAR
jgi:glutamate:GABA antiporter